MASSYRGQPPYQTVTSNTIKKKRRKAQPVVDVDSSQNEIELDIPDPVTEPSQAATTPMPTTPDEDLVGVEPTVIKHRRRLQRQFAAVEEEPFKPGPTHDTDPTEAEIGPSQNDEGEFGARECKSHRLKIFFSLAK